MKRPLGSTAIDAAFLLRVLSVRVDGFVLTPSYSAPSLRKALDQPTLDQAKCEWIVLRKIGR